MHEVNLSRPLPFKKQKEKRHEVKYVASSGEDDLKLAPQDQPIIILYEYYILKFVVIYEGEALKLTTPQDFWKPIGSEAYWI